MPLDQTARAELFTDARTHNQWKAEPVSDETLRELYDLVKMGPTSANTSPARFVFVRTAEAKERLKPALSAGNLDKTMAAPVTVIVAYDPQFFEQLPKLFPHADARAWFAGNDALATETAFRNVGLDAGPMSGFDKAKVDEAFFASSGWKSNFLVNLGHGDGAGLFPRSPRLAFDEACILL